MTSEYGKEFGFAAAHDVPIPYLQRIRDYYKALGYGASYEWAHYSEVPFRPLHKPLSRSRVTIITTAAPYQPDKGDQGTGAPYDAAARSCPESPRGSAGSADHGAILADLVCESRLEARLQQHRTSHARGDQTSPG